MKEPQLLVIASLLSIVLLTLHFTSDVLRARPENLESGGSTLITVPLLALFLYGTLMLPHRRFGHVLMLILALIAVLMLVPHAIGPTGLFTGHMARGNGGDFIFVWGLHLLGVNGLFSLVLAVRALLRIPEASVALSS